MNLAQRLQRIEERVRAIGADDEPLVILEYVTDWRDENPRVPAGLVTREGRIVRVNDWRRVEDLPPGTQVLSGYDPREDPRPRRDGG